MKDITVFLTEQFESKKEADVNEGKVASEKDFREFARAMAEEAFGDKFDEDKFKETVDKFLFIFFPVLWSGPPRSGYRTHRDPLRSA